MDLDVISALALGILQGLTEFLPVSSSGHLALMQYFLCLRETPVFFDVLLHVGTLAAVLAFYGRDLWRGGPLTLKSAASEPEGDLTEPPSWWGTQIRLAWLLVLATLPAALAAVVFRPSPSVDRPLGAAVPPPTWTEQVGNLREDANQHPPQVLLTLAVTGVVLLIGSRRLSHAAGKREFADTLWRDALLIGIAQMFSALFPGLSRSGMTVTAALLLGLRPAWAVHFSLLMSIPAILGAAILKLRDVPSDWLTPENLTAALVGTVAAAVVGWVCIALLLAAVRRQRWWWFTLYLWLLVAAVSIYLSLQPAVKPIATGL